MGFKDFFTTDQRQITPTNICKPSACQVQIFTRRDFLIFVYGHMAQHVVSTTNREESKWKDFFR